MMGPAPHTQLDAELAAGMGTADNGPKLMCMWQFEILKPKVWIDVATFELAFLEFVGK